MKIQERYNKQKSKYNLSFRLEISYRKKEDYLTISKHCALIFRYESQVVTFRFFGCITHYTSGEIVSGIVILSYW